MAATTTATLAEDTSTDRELFPPATDIHAVANECAAPSGGADVAGTWVAAETTIAAVSVVPAVPAQEAMADATGESVTSTATTEPSAKAMTDAAAEVLADIVRPDAEAQSTAKTMTDAATEASADVVKAMIDAEETAAVSDENDDDDGQQYNDEDVVYADHNYVGDGEIPVVQEGSESVITPSAAKGNNMKTCWICIPLKHIHKQARHTAILNDITFSLKETAKTTLAFVGVEKAQVAGGGKQQEFWLLLVKPKGTLYFL